MSKDVVEALVSAVQRLDVNLHRAVRGLPLRDMEETLAESQAALDAARDLKEEDRRTGLEPSNPDAARLVAATTSALRPYMVEIETDGRFADKEQLLFILNAALRDQGITIRSLRP